MKLFEFFSRKKRLKKALNLKDFSCVVSLYILHVTLDENIFDFSSMKKLERLTLCNNISKFPILPDSLKFLDLSGNNLKELKTKFPSKLETFICSKNKLILISLKKCKYLKKIDMSYNKLSSFSIVSDTMEELNVSNNKINIIKIYSTNLRVLNCKGNNITSSIICTNKLEELNISHNFLTVLDQVPMNLIKLDCSFNLLRKIPILPNSLKYLNITSNNINFINSLPPNLETLYANSNKINYINRTIPATLKYVFLVSNKLVLFPRFHNLTEPKKIRIKYNKSKYIKNYDDYIVYSKLKILYAKSILFHFIKNKKHNILSKKNKNINTQIVFHPFCYKLIEDITSMLEEDNIKII